MIETWQQYLYEQMSTGVSSSWHWFNTLSREEWLVVLAVTCLLGFLMIKGFGTRRQF